MNQKIMLAWVLKNCKFAQVRQPVQPQRPRRMPFEATPVPPAPQPPLSSGTPVPAPKPQPPLSTGTPAPAAAPAAPAAPTMQKMPMNDQQGRANFYSTMGEKGGFQAPIDPAWVAKLSPEQRFRYDQYKGMGANGQPKIQQLQKELTGSPV